MILLQTATLSKTGSANGKKEIHAEGDGITPGRWELFPWRAALLI